MADDDARRWVVEPPEAGEISLHMALGNGVELTSEQETALVELVRSLESADAEVTGFGECTRLSRCPTLMCEPLCENVRCSLSNVSQGWNVMGTFGSSPS